MQEMKAQEIFSIGTWNERTFSAEDLDGIASSFDALNLAGKVPLKLSHEGPDERFDPTSKLAMGWVQRVWRDGNRLLADFEVPEKVAGLIKEKYLKFVSIELLRDVQAGTRLIRWVLDAVALLGSDQPAVGELQALTAFAATKLQFRERIAFTRGASAMSDETEKLRNELKKANHQMALMTLNHAITSGRIYPREREQFTRRYPDNGTPADATEWISTSQKPPSREGRTGSRATESETFARPDAEVLAAAREEADLHFSKTGQHLDLYAAGLAVMRKNSGLALRYVRSNGEQTQ